ncbi:MAG: hypothetical protein KJO07_23185 [Deltaproteobacteria bacterium]|nr:hypothetical protein [Deltaproteobacteria bacterium]
MVRVVVALVALLLSSGCLIFDSESSASRQEACLAVCECLFFSPTAARGCADECVDDPDILPPSQVCLDCLTTNTCEVVESGGCNADCSNPDPTN